MLIFAFGAVRKLSEVPAAGRLVRVDDALYGCEINRRNARKISR